MSSPESESGGPKFRSVPPMSAFGPNKKAFGPNPWDETTSPRLPWRLWPENWHSSGSSHLVGVPPPQFQLPPATRPSTVHAPQFQLPLTPRPSTVRAPTPSPTRSATPSPLRPSSPSLPRLPSTARQLTGGSRQLLSPSRPQSPLGLLSRNDALPHVEADEWFVCLESATFLADLHKRAEGNLLASNGTPLGEVRAAVRHPRSLAARIHFHRIWMPADAIGVRDSSSSAALDGDGAASDRRVQSQRGRTTLELRWQTERFSIPSLEVT